MRPYQERLSGLVLGFRCPGPATGSPFAHGLRAAHAVVIKVPKQLRLLIHLLDGRRRSLTRLLWADRVLLLNELLQINKCRLDGAEAPAAVRAGEQAEANTRSERSPLQRGVPVRQVGRIRAPVLTQTVQQENGAPRDCAAKIVAAEVVTIVEV